MTVDEKREALIKGCVSHTSGCGTCKLMRTKGVTCNFETASSDEIDKQYSAFFDVANVPEPDNVNHPAHYQGAHECIDVMKAMFGVEAVKAFCRCNAFKYRFRAGMKNGEEDIRKAEWYEDYLIKLIEQEGGNDTDRT